LRAQNQKTLFSVKPIGHWILEVVQFKPWSWPSASRQDSYYPISLWINNHLNVLWVTWLWNN